MTTTHTVEPGDWIGNIAERHGFEHWSALWEHPANAPLRELRSSPDLLMLGDEVRIPELNDVAGIEVRSNQRVTFKLRPDDMLRLRLQGISGFAAAFGAVPYVLTIGDRTIEGELSADDQELIEIPLRAGDTTATLRLMDSVAVELSIGGLGPANEGRGAYARLVNLGFGAADGAGGAQAKQEQGGDPLALALRAFQRREGLTVDGALDVRTATALRDRYGG